MNNDTTMFASRTLRPQTHWSVLLAARDPMSPEHDAAREDLCRSYWRPVYHHICAHWHKNTDEARDLTQEFFLAFFRRRFLDQVTPGRTRFRAFLRAFLENFLRNARDSELAQKRGGGHVITGLDVETSDWGAYHTLASTSTADSFSAQWKAHLIQEAVRRLEADYAREGKPAYADVFKLYLLEPDQTYGSVAQKLGLKEDDVLNYLRHARHRFKLMLRQIVWDTVESPLDFQQEMKELFGVDA